MEKLTVMGIGAHPDDLELFCGGTLAKYAEGVKAYRSSLRIGTVRLLP